MILYNTLTITRSMSEGESNSDSQGHSELMVETIEPESPPNEEVVEYAVDVLGMILPEDEALLYLAREAMTSNVPPEWQVYQRPNGDIYYRNKVTREKLLTHPADIFFIQRYREEKRRLETERKRIGMLEEIHEVDEMSQSPEFTKRMYGVEEEVEESLEDLQYKLKRRMKQLRKEEQGGLLTFQKRDVKTYNSIQQQVERYESIKSVEGRIALTMSQIRSELMEQMQKKYEVISRQIWKELYCSMQREEKSNLIQAERGFREYKKQLGERLATQQKHVESLKSQLKSINLIPSSEYLLQRRLQLMNGIQLWNPSEIEKQISLVNLQCTNEYSIKILKAREGLERESKSIIDNILNQGELKKKEYFVQISRLQLMSNKRVETIRNRDKLRIENQHNKNLLRCKKEISDTREGEYKTQLRMVEESLDLNYKDKMEQLSIIRKEKEELSRQLLANQNAKCKEIKRPNNVKPPSESHNEIASRINNPSTFKKAALLRSKLRQQGKQIQRVRAQISIMCSLLEHMQLITRVRSSDRNPGSEHITSILREVPATHIKISPTQTPPSKDNPLKVLREKLEEDRKFLLRVRHYFESNALQPLQERAKVKSLRLPEELKAQRLRAIGGATTNLRNMYLKDLQTFTQNQRQINQFEQAFRHKKTERGEMGVPAMCGLILRERMGSGLGGEREDWLCVEEKTKVERIVSAVAQFKREMGGALNRMRCTTSI